MQNHLREEQQRIEAERIHRLKLDEQRKKEEEEKLRSKLSKEGRDAIANWYVGSVEKVIRTAQENNFSDILENWLQYAQELQVGAKGTDEHIDYRINTTITKLGAALLSLDSSKGS